jgi:hypothetical protein
MPLDLDTVILNLRGFRVILDLDLTLLYGISSKRLNEQAKRNRGRFPEDFIFQLEEQEVKMSALLRECARFCGYTAFRN